MDNSARIGKKIKSTTAGETFYAYMPNPLPPQPPLNMETIYPLLDRANIAVGRLDGIGHMLPEQGLFLYLYIRKEAVLSSQIEGTQSSLSDLLTHENEETPGAPYDDVTEVSSYVAAMEYGLKRLKQDKFPLSLRLIKEIHSILLNHGRGSNKMPGEFRRSQNWIGGTRPGNAAFVPPPPDKLTETLSDLEKFIHSDQNMPTLVKAALMHVQFETIHPFLDGNGRLGRLLITFLLCSEGLLEKPLLYLSLFFKANRQDYYRHLQSVRETGDWELWVEFFLDGVIITAEQVLQTTQEISNLFSQDIQKINSLGRPAMSALQVFNDLKTYPVNTIAKIADHCNMTVPTVTKSLQHLIDLQIITESTGKDRGRQYQYTDYLTILNRGIGEF